MGMSLPFETKLLWTFFKMSIRISSFGRMVTWLLDWIPRSIVRRICSQVLLFAFVTCVILWLQGKPFSLSTLIQNPGEGESWHAAIKAHLHEGTVIFLVYFAIVGLPVLVHKYARARNKDAVRILSGVIERIAQWECLRSPHENGGLSTAILNDSEAQTLLVKKIREAKEECIFISPDMRFLCSHIWPKELFECFPREYKEALEKTQDFAIALNDALERTEANLCFIIADPISTRVKYELKRLAANLNADPRTFLKANKIAIKWVKRLRLKRRRNFNALPPEKQKATVPRTRLHITSYWPNVRLFVSRGKFCLLRRLGDKTIENHLAISKNESVGDRKSADPTIRMLYTAVETIRHNSIRL
jgi:hypothetical protein